ncbi:MAG: hypothetical protein PHE68_05995 [Candidatus Peribacteraceae bacterium]|nr:hypothetical protein [Candidatus Peribacteraceae bacterium]MDD5074608.1 hypothetical protein [Candidatus Peribacteraceae bacterium]
MLPRNHPPLDSALKALSEQYRGNGQPHPKEFPDRIIIAQTVESLLDLLFPEHRLGHHDITETIAHIGQRVFNLLTEQVRIANLHCEELPPVHGHGVLGLFRAMPEIRRNLMEDMQAAYQGDPAARGPDEVIVSYPTTVATGTYRLAHELHRQKVPLIPRMMTEYAHRLTGIDIHPGAIIGRSFFIDHGTGVVIGETTEIGDRVRLYQGVTLGAANFRKDEHGRLIRRTKRHPTLEDDVIVYANATILGGDTVIGARSVIGSNVWLAESVAPDSVVTSEKPELHIRAKR